MSWRLALSLFFGFLAMFLIFFAGFSSKDYYTSTACSLSLFTGFISILVSISFAQSDGLTRKKNDQN